MVHCLLCKLTTYMNRATLHFVLAAAFNKLRSECSAGLLRSITNYLQDRSLLVRSTSRPEKGSENLILMYLNITGVVWLCMILIIVSRP